MGLSSINFTGLIIVFFLAFCIALYYSKAQDKEPKQENKLNLIIASFYIAVIITGVYFIYFEYLPNSSPSTCSIDGDVCGPYKG